jgi:hypothetical protein
MIDLTVQNLEQAFAFLVTIHEKPFIVAAAFGTKLEALTMNLVVLPLADVDVVLAGHHVHPLSRARIVVPEAHISIAQRIGFHAVAMLNISVLGLALVLLTSLILDQIPLLLRKHHPLLFIVEIKNSLHYSFQG